MSDTQKNLQEAFAGESQANHRYLFFADKAKKEGHPQIARLFRAAAEAEAVHAHNHLEAMCSLKSTKGNLEEAVAGEHHEFTEMYPGFIEQAKVEGNSDAETSFFWANKVEKIHHGLFEKALEAVREDKKPVETVYYVCERCGNTVEGEAPDKCPICGAPKDRFTLVD